MEDRCIQGLDSVPPSVRNCVLTIGNFDGVHLGHQRILHAARELADTKGSAVVAMTFDPPPDLVLRPDDLPERITPTAAKCEFLLAAGADCVVVAKSDRQLLSLTSEEFIERIVVRRFSPAEVVEGRNFFFGRGRAGNVETLKVAGSEKGFAVHVVEPVVLELAQGHERVSSTLIRRLVAAGNIEDANRCLGRQFTLYGAVIGGHGHGRILDFPTANIDPAEQIIPADGVYAGRARVGGEEFLAAISIGNKPTLGPAELTVEAFLLGAKGDFYDQHMALSFVTKLREQQRFERLESLRAQIAKDVQRVRQTVK